MPAQHLTSVWTVAGSGPAFARPGFRRRAPALLPRPPPLDGFSFCFCRRTTPREGSLRNDEAKAVVGAWWMALGVASILLLASPSASAVRAAPLLGEPRPNRRASTSSVGVATPSIVPCHGSPLEPSCLAASSQTALKSDNARQSPQTSTCAATGISNVWNCCDLVWPRAEGVPCMYHRRLSTMQG